MGVHAGHPGTVLDQRVQSIRSTVLDRHHHAVGSSLDRRSLPGADVGARVARAVAVYGVNAGSDILHDRSAGDGPRQTGGPDVGRHPTGSTDGLRRGGPGDRSDAVLLGFELLVLLAHGLFALFGVPQRRHPTGDKLVDLRLGGVGLGLGSGRRIDLFLRFRLRLFGLILEKLQTGEPDVELGLGGIEIGQCVVVSLGDGAQGLQPGREVTRVVGVEQDLHLRVRTALLVDLTGHLADALLQERDLLLGLRDLLLGLRDLRDGLGHLHVGSGLARLRLGQFRLRRGQFLAGSGQLLLGGVQPLDRGLDLRIRSRQVVRSVRHVLVDVVGQSWDSRPAQRQAKQHRRGYVTYPAMAATTGQSGHAPLRVPSYP